jgi:hypothetical protein
LFDEAQFQAVITRIDEGIDDLSVKIGEVPPAANAALANPLLPPEVRDAIVRVAQEIVEVAEEFLRQVKELLQGALAPRTFFQMAYHWQDVRGTAAGVAAQVKPDLMPAASAWSGPAAASYTRVIRPQGEAAGRIATIGERTALALNGCAVAGLAFYVFLGIILAKFIVAMVAAIAAFGTGVFSPVGAGIVIEEAGVNSSLVISALTTLGAALTAQAASMIALHGEAVDNSAFPGGRWPNPVSGGRYDDATVTDGDADWSLHR